MIQFNTEFRKILEDVEITSPHPQVYKLEKTDKGLYKRTYHSGSIAISKDRNCNILHNLDGPAQYYPAKIGYGSELNIYYIDGQLMTKSEWEKVRHLYGKLKIKKDLSTAQDLLNI
jgi:hypothetical protein